MDLSAHLLFLGLGCLFRSFLLGLNFLLTSRHDRILLLNFFSDFEMSTKNGSGIEMIKKSLFLHFLLATNLFFVCQRLGSLTCFNHVPNYQIRLARKRESCDARNKMSTQESDARLAKGAKIIGTMKILVPC